MKKLFLIKLTVILLLLTGILPLQAQAENTGSNTIPSIQATNVTNSDDFAAQFLKTEKSKPREAVVKLLYQDGKPAGWLGQWALIIILSMSVYTLYYWVKFIGGGGSILDPVKFLFKMIVNCLICGYIATNVITIFDGIKSIQEVIINSVDEQLEKITDSDRSIIAGTDIAVDNSLALNTIKQSLNPNILSYAATRAPEKYGTIWNKENLDAIKTAGNTANLMPVKIDEKLYVAFAMPMTNNTPTEYTDREIVKLKNFNLPYIIAYEDQPTLKGIKAPALNNPKNKYRVQDTGTTEIMGTGRTAYAVTGNAAILYGGNLQSIINEIDTNPKNPLFIKEYVRGKNSNNFSDSDVIRNRSDASKFSGKNIPAKEVLKDARYRAIAEKIMRDDTIQEATDDYLQTAAGATGNGGRDESHWIVKGITNFVSTLFLQMGKLTSWAFSLCINAAFWLSCPFLCMSAPLLISPNEKHQAAFWGQFKAIITLALLPIIGSITTAFLWMCLIKPIIEFSLGSGAILVPAISLISPIATIIITFKAAESIFTGKGLVGGIMQAALESAKTATTITAAVVTGGIAGAGMAMGAAGGAGGLSTMLGGAAKGAMGAVGQSMSMGGLGDAASGVKSMFKGSNSSAGATNGNTGNTPPTASLSNNNSNQTSPTGGGGNGPSGGPASGGGGNGPSSGSPLTQNGSGTADKATQFDAASGKFASSAKNSLQEQTSSAFNSLDSAANHGDVGAPPSAAGKNTKGADSAAIHKHQAGTHTSRTEVTPGEQNTSTSTNNPATTSTPILNSPATASSLTHTSSQGADSQTVHTHQEGTNQTKIKAASPKPSAPSGPDIKVD
jgi:hypothetical protein